MNYQDLFDKVRSYYHRKDLDDAILDFQLDLAIERIGKTLRSRLNEREIILDTSSGMSILPVDFEELRHVSNAVGVLGYETPMTYRETKQGYTMESNAIYYNGDELSLVYWHTPEKTATGADDLVLNKYKSMYLYGLMAEVARYLSDGDVAAQFQNLYVIEANEANRFARISSVGNNPTLRG